MANPKLMYIGFFIYLCIILSVFIIGAWFQFPSYSGYIYLVLAITGFILICLGMERE